MLRDFDSIADFFSEREVDELQAAIDARREARAGRLEDVAPPPLSEPAPHVLRRTGAPPPA